MDQTKPPVKKDGYVLDEAAFEALYDSAEIKKRRDSAEKKYGGLTTADYERLRRKCKNDLFFLCSGPLEYELLSPRLHGNVCHWMQKNEGHRYKMILLPRDHYKSTTITVADSIRTALPDIDGNSAYPYSLGPNVKLLLAHEVREKAAGFLFEITAAFTRKELMLYLFPELIPTKNVQRMNKWELELPRTEHHKEATFNTIGAGGASQGGHFHWLFLDDLVGEEARDSQTVMKRVLTWFDNVNSLLTRPRFDGWNLIGTRWGMHDVYSHAMSIYGIDERHSVLNAISNKEIEKYMGGLLRVYARGMIESGELIFPEENDWDYVKILRKNPMVWAAQYANNPIESGLTFFKWPIKFYNTNASQEIVVFTGESSWKRSLSDLDICVFCDPSMGENQHADETGIIVTGVDQKSNIFILETVKKRLRPPDLIDELYRLHFKYRPRLVAVEEVNFSAVYRYWIQERNESSGINLPIRPYKPGSKRDKEARIQGLAHFFSAGQVYAHEGMHELRDEVEQFPLGKGFHLLDALAQGPEFWTRGVSRRDVTRQRVQEEEILAERDAMTGY